VRLPCALRVLCLLALCAPVISWALASDVRSGDRIALGERPQETPAQREISVRNLPQEARSTLALVKQGGPFPYKKDGSTFGNREKHLPVKARGYYREYTVPTPGARDRGARRIVAGRDGEYYYSDDHYNSFRRIRE
jgi:ribonuclease T1